MMASKVFLILFLPVCNAVFMEDYARKMLNFVAASFIPADSPDHAELIHDCFQFNLPREWTLLKQQSIDPCGEYIDGECALLIAVSHTRQIVTFAFHGTITRDRMSIFANLTSANYVPLDYSPDPKVNKDVYNVSEEFWSTEIQKVLTDYSGYFVTFTGHSFGGALASLTAFKAQILGLTPELAVYTFGKPRFGDFQFAEAFKACISDGFRIVHNNDIVPHMPLCGAHFTDPCLQNGDNPYHHPEEIWYSNASSSMDYHDYVKCNVSNGEDPKCSNSYSESDLLTNYQTNQGAETHMAYYNHKINDYGRAGCKDLLTSTTAGLPLTTMSQCTDSDADCLDLSSECKNSLYKPLMCKYCRKSCNLCNDSACDSKSQKF